MMKKKIFILMTMISLSQPSYANCRKTLQELSTHSDGIKEAVVISRQPITPQHFLLWPLVEMYAASRSAIMASAAWWNWWNPLGYCFGACAVAQNISARDEANRAISRDVGIQALMMQAYLAGQEYEGQVPKELVTRFADAFEKMTTDLDNWPKGLAHKVLNKKTKPRKDGHEIARWNKRQINAALAKPLKHLVDELGHNAYAVAEPILHLTQHRLSALRALLQGRPMDAYTLSFVGDLDTFSDDYH